MPPKKEKLLKEFDKVVAALQLLFRSRQSLTENEQLFIENRLMILQMEYSLCTKRPKKVVPVAEKDQLLKGQPHVPDHDSGGRSSTVC